jgi:hypothetical protein
MATDCSLYSFRPSSLGEKVVIRQTRSASKEGTGQVQTFNRHDEWEMMSEVGLEL